jgi:hypothetical protein
MRITLATLAWTAVCLASPYASNAQEDLAKIKTIVVIYAENRSEPPQSMISSARCMTASGIVRPCAFAVYVQFHCRSVDLGVNKGQ